ncbi:hypothetical protein BKA65DRAFT_494909 [Rhexocercosporidium sp. MPI-PUGE-AT-0058]|nr:hypothetical protein BKA65DRAFT_494909 [Rhexocercosporidium sp. MPI-PUGE-AT-0058]
MNSVAVNTLPSLVPEDFQDLFHPLGCDALLLPWWEEIQYKIDREPTVTGPATLPEREDLYSLSFPSGPESSTSNSIFDGLWTDLARTGPSDQLSTQTPASMQYIPSTGDPITVSQGSTYHQPSQNPQALLYCTWPGCTNTEAWQRPSDLKKHMDKHTRPYICREDKCHNLTFGDKAGLHRHKREVHEAAKLFCPFSSCRRYSKGFPRQRNLDVHLRTQHKGPSEEDHVMLSDELQSSSFDAGDDGSNVGAEIQEMSGAKLPGTDISSLYLKLQEREAEKRELALRQARVDEDILALRRALTVISA